MKIYRIVYGEENEVESYHVTLEAAKEHLVSAMLEKKENGDPWWDYTWRRIDELEFDENGNADNADWDPVFKAWEISYEMQETFPKPDDWDWDDVK